MYWDDALNNIALATAVMADINAHHAIWVYTSRLFQHLYYNTACNIN